MTLNNQETIKWIFVLIANEITATCYTRQTAGKERTEILKGTRDLNIMIYTNTHFTSKTMSFFNRFQLIHCNFKVGEKITINCIWDAIT